MRQILSAVSFLPPSVLFLSFCLLTPCSRADVYRYTDEQGAVVLNRQGVPPQHVGKGYQVLNEQGRVIKVVPPAPTAEEIQQKKAEQARQEMDKRLLRLYANFDDFHRARQKKLRDFDSLIESTQSQLPLLSKKLDELYEKIDASRRIRGAVQNPEWVEEVKWIKAEQRRLHRQITEYRAQRHKAEEEFEQEQTRLVELFGLPS